MTIFEQMFFSFGPIVFSFAGLLVAGYVFLKKKTSQPMVCPLNGECELVTTSKYSKFFGVPVELLGMLYYGLVFLTYTANFLFPLLLNDTIFFVMIGMSIGAFVFSVYLIFIQAFVLKKWCTWCLFSAGFSTLIFLATVLGTDVDIVAFLSEYKTPIIIIHALAAAVGVGTATITDIFFFKFLRDYKISESEHELMDTLSNIIWFALGIIILTGIGLYLPASERLLDSSKFLTKVVAVLVVTINGVFLNLVVSPKMMQMDFSESNNNSKTRFMRRLSFALGGISISSWYLIFILGSLKSIPIPFKTAIVLYGLLLCFAIVASQLLDRKMVKNYQKEYEQK
jgi:uncharacterized membrane protein